MKKILLLMFIGFALLSVKARAQTVTVVEQSSSGPSSPGSLTYYVDASGYFYYTFTTAAVSPGCEVGFYLTDYIANDYYYSDSLPGPDYDPSTGLITLSGSAYIGTSDAYFNLSTNLTTDSETDDYNAILYVTWP